MLERLNNTLLKVLELDFSPLARSITCSFNIFLLPLDMSDYAQSPFTQQVIIVYQSSAFVILRLALGLYLINFHPFFSQQMNNIDAPMGMAVGMPEVKGLPVAVDLTKNPLADTHEFKQACSICYVKTGEEFFIQLCAVCVFEVRNVLLSHICFFIYSRRSWCIGLLATHRRA